MGITERKWTVHDSGNPEKVGRLATELGVDRVLAELLVQRGVETFEQARRFFRPSLDDLHDPFLMKDMDKAVERLHEAITKGQKILVYGDYDVDGTTAVALVYSFVKRFTKRVEYYIPDRYDEAWTGPRTTASTSSSPWTAASRPSRRWSTPGARAST